MSLEAALAENTAAMKDLIAALKVTGENQERLIAGQTTAIDMAESGKATRTRTRKPRGSEAEPAVTEPEVVAAEPVSETAQIKPVSVDDLKATAVAFMSEEGADLDARKAFVVSVLKNFGASKLQGEGVIADGIERSQAVFFIKRAAKGLKVDFKADYDFTGPVDQGGAPAEDDFGL